MSDWREEVRRRLSRLNLEPAHEAEIVEELAQHLDDVYERSLKAGVTEAEAKRAVLTELSDAELLRNEMRRSQKFAKAAPVAGGGRTNLLADFLNDLRYAVRLQRKNPGFTIVAVIALALGIGANTAIFSVVNTVLLRPLPYKDPERLVMVWEEATKAGYPTDTPAAANFVDWRDQNQAFEGMAAIADESFNLTGSGDPERLEGRRVSANLFPLLGVEPQLGRVFAAAEDQPGSERVVLLSYKLWQRRFGGDAGIVGKTLNLNGAGYTVVGVMPARFQFPTADDEAWVPIAFTQEDATNRGRHYLEVVGRLKPSVTLPQAQAEMSTNCDATTTTVSAIEHRFGGSNHTFARTPRGRYQARVADLAGCSWTGVTDRVCECRQSLTRASSGETKRDRRPRRTRRATFATDPPIFNRECLVVGFGRTRRSRDCLRRTGGVEVFHS
jgi:hypothetical protein